MAKSSREVDLLVLAPLGPEYAAVRRRIARFRSIHGESRACGLGDLGLHRTALVQTGPGPNRAQESTEWALDRFRPSGATVLGFAGGLAPSLATGDVVVADRLLSVGHLSADDPPLIVDPPLIDLGERPRHVGTIVGTTHVVEDAKSKHDLFVSQRALAVDMESYAAADACLRRGIACSVVRVISDDASSTAPRELLGFVRDDGSIDPLRAAATLIRRPDLWSHAWRMHRNIRIAKRSLEMVAEAIADEPIPGTGDARRNQGDHGGGITKTER